MPELPEVETIIRELATLRGARIDSLQVLDPRLDIPADEISGATIEGVGRRGKYIVFHLSGGRLLIVHLRMSGRLTLTRSPVEEKHTRLILYLDRGKVYFIDPRRLGTVEYSRNDFPHQLGVEPLSAEFTAEYLREAAAASRAPIKLLLMDQKRVAGLGNIYSVEALWRGGVDPRRAGNTLTEGEIKGLHRGIVKLLYEAIERMGTTIGRSISDYRTAFGDYGDFQGLLVVYGREGEPCPRCSAAIERIVQAGRSTFFCPGCQG